MECPYCKKEIDVQSSQRECQPKRYYRAKNTANVTTIQRTIEEVFGLPTGSVTFLKPDKKQISPKAKIAKLRNYWEYNEQ